MFRRRNKVDPPHDNSSAPAEVYLGLRGQILNLDPASVGIAPTGRSSWGCVMEMGYPNATATLVCLSDGTTSLYTSSGFGIIGGGMHEEVVRATTKLLEVLDDHLAETSPSTEQALPAQGRTIIRALTNDGQRLFEASEDDLGEGRSAMSPGSMPPTQSSPSCGLWTRRGTERTNLPEKARSADLPTGLRQFRDDELTTARRRRPGPIPRAPRGGLHGRPRAVPRHQTARSTVARAHGPGAARRAVPASTSAWLW